MVTFKFAINQDDIELQASDWCGLEKIYINGQHISSKLNFSQQSEYTLMLNDGKAAKLHLLLDPITEQLVCRIYKQNNLVASLKQGKRELYRSRLQIQQGMLAIGVTAVFLLILG
ncbi:hypothetical protein L2719_11655 [Shewanella schlegeliana]|uniref:Uncharacterized protein n=1 Tax=Shewanella schlegeliana TaxID=190308 RepID=A0ABS1STH6_9GAMM|nr:hypothetical protein [Shewanella schlegeliana]MBL4911842.1 hypothetical protein [Shewanella schlegeliana]MCL1110205.1 hypothetical protein [Shewanella schlegeliana]GIU27207.1 hypothetical protein TUM4433_13990 [Shewanella schlegeliana]